jgi:hypothetical protein
MDFLIRKVLSETEYAAQSSTLDPYDGVVIVSDSDPAVVVKLAIGSQTFLPSSGGDVYAPSDGTYLTASDETTPLPNSIDLHLTNPDNGTQSIMMNNPVSSSAARIETLPLTDNDSGFMWVNNAGALTQTRTLDFQTTSGDQDWTVNNINILQFTANAFALNGNTVGSDTGFDGPLMTTNAFESNTTEIVFRRKVIGTALTVAVASNVDLSVQGGFYATGLTSSTGTDLILGAGNQVFLKTSSERFKEDIDTFDAYTGALDRYSKLRPVTYRYKREDGEVEKQRLAIGLIAEEVEKLFPEAVNMDAENSPFSISYDQICTITLSVVQGMLKEITKLKERVSTLENGI